MNDCVLWDRCIQRNGYGRIRHNGKTYYVHRFVWEQTYHRSIPKGMDVRHKCDVRHCINPKHLELGTRFENMRDCVDRNRISHGEKHKTIMQVVAAKGTDHGHAKLTNAAIRYIRRALAQGATKASLARRFGTHPMTVRAVELRRTWRHVK